MEHVRDKTGRETESGEATKADSDATGEETNTFDAFGVRVEYLNTLDWLGRGSFKKGNQKGNKVTKKVTFLDFR
jgi:hypothetical protein